MFLSHVVFAAAKSLQSCPTLCDPIDGHPPGSSVPGILQARTLEWVAISFSNAWKWKMKVKSLSPVRLLATPWTAAHQAPLSLGFSRQEYWSGCQGLLRACPLEAGNHSYWAHMLQPLQPGPSRARALQQEKPPPWEAHAPQLQKSPSSSENPLQPKNKLIN